MIFGSRLTDQYVRRGSCIALATRLPIDHVWRIARETGCFAMLSAVLRLAFYGGQRTPGFYAGWAPDFWLVAQFHSAQLTMPVSGWGRGA